MGEQALPPEAPEREGGEVGADRKRVPPEIDGAQLLNDVGRVKGTRADHPGEDGDAEQEAGAGPPREEASADVLRRGVGTVGVVHGGVGTRTVAGKGGGRRGSGHVSAVQCG